MVAVSPFYTEDVSGTAVVAVVRKPGGEAATPGTDGELGGDGKLCRLGVFKGLSHQVHDTGGRGALLPPEGGGNRPRLSHGVELTLEDYPGKHVYRGIGPQMDAVSVIVLILPQVPFHQFPGRGEVLYVYLGQSPGGALRRGFFQGELQPVLLACLLYLLVHEGYDL